MFALQAVKAEVWFDGQKKDGKDMLFAIERDLRSCLDLLFSAFVAERFKTIYECVLQNHGPKNITIHNVIHMGSKYCQMCMYITVYASIHYMYMYIYILLCNVGVDKGCFRYSVTLNNHFCFSGLKKLHEAPNRPRKAFPPRSRSSK